MGLKKSEQNEDSTEFESASWRRERKHSVKPPAAGQIRVLFTFKTQYLIVNSQFASWLERRPLLKICQIRFSVLSDNFYYKTSLKCSNFPFLRCNQNALKI